MCKLRPPSDCGCAHQLLDTANNTNRKLAHRIGDLESLYKAAQSEVNHMTKLYSQLKGSHTSVARHRRTLTLCHVSSRRPA